MIVQDDELYSKLASLTENFIGAEIEQVVVSALYEAFFENRALKYSDFVNTIKNTVPLCTTQKEEILRLREWANVRAVAATKKTQEIEKEDIQSSRGGRALDF